MERFFIPVNFVLRNMLQKLHIQNYAIIDTLDISFSRELNIITGETGAGKSILMGALNLILGHRADSNVLQNKTEKCIVEALFQVPGNEEMKTFLESNDLEVSDEILIRREIAVNGKSRGFINDTPVNLGQLKEAGSKLVDLHQQFDTLELGNEQFQRQVLDALADNRSLLQNLNASFLKYTETKNELDALRLQESTAAKEYDYNKFLFDELAEINLKENELEELDEELKLLTNAEQIKQNLGMVYQELKEGEQPFVQKLKNFQQKIASVQEFHTDLPGLLGRLKSSAIELQDIADDLENIDSSIQFDEERIAYANDRISHGYKLQKKHGLSTTNELLDIQKELQYKLDAVVNISDAIKSSTESTARLLKDCEGIAAAISRNRLSKIASFTANVNELLHQVGMPNARIKIDMQPAKMSMYGIDEVMFLFDANKSNRFEPLSKVASGGELSRLMLSIKSLVAKKLELPTLIFDEIDTGISGEAAKQVGIIMKGLAAGHQLIVISHQPQIAARASAHYFVYKQNRNDKIATSIRLLSKDERINTIAQMLGGEKPTAAAIANAKEMVAD